MWVSKMASLKKTWQTLPNHPEPLTAPFSSSIGIAWPLLEDAEEIAFKWGTISKMSSPAKWGTQNKKRERENWKGNKKKRRSGERRQKTDTQTNPLPFPALNLNLKIYYINWHLKQWNLKNSRKYGHMSQLNPWLIFAQAPGSQPPGPLLDLLLHRAQSWSECHLYSRHLPSNKGNEQLNLSSEVLNLLNHLLKAMVNTAAMWLKGA